MTNSKLKLKYILCGCKEKMLESIQSPTEIILFHIINTSTFCH